MLPEKKWVFHLIVQKRMPSHIIKHSLMVRKVAAVIACSCVVNGCEVNPRLVETAALLHDISKMDSITDGGDHSLMGKHLLESLGYPHIGDVIGQHVRLNELILSEAMIVNYADKRVMHDKIVSLERRFVDLMDRYGKDDARMERILKMYEKAVSTEKMIVEASKIDPEWLNNFNSLSCIAFQSFLKTVNGC